jgi:hypothetical protein
MSGSVENSLKGRYTFVLTTYTEVKLAEVKLANALRKFDPVYCSWLSARFLCLLRISLLLSQLPVLVLSTIDNSKWFQFVSYRRCSEGRSCWPPRSGRSCRCRPPRSGMSLKALPSSDLSVWGKSGWGDKEHGEFHNR